MKYITLLLIALFIFFVGCQKSRRGGGRSITLNLQEGNPPTLHPYVGVDLRSRCLFLALFEPLMRRQSDGRLEPAAAESVEIDPSQTVYTFHMRPHTWSNGEAVTSYHFANAWKYALTPGTPCCRTDLFYPIKNAEKVKKGELPLNWLGIAAPNPETLVITLEHPTPYFLDLTATSFFSPLYHASLEEEPTCFNGPFLIKEWLPDHFLKLEPNSRYWDAQSVEVKEICFTMVKDPTTAFAMFERQELDLVGDPFSPLPFDLIPTLEKSDSLHKKKASRLFYVLLNTETFPLNNKALRNALSLCIDRKQLTKHLFFGEIPTIAPLPVTLSFFEDQENTVDSATINALFEQALSELQISRAQFPKLIFSYAELSGQKKLAEFVQSQWKEKLGIEIEIVCNEWNVHSVNLRKGNYQIGTIHLTTLYSDPMFYFDLFRNKNSPTNYCRWENEHFRFLLEESERTCDIGEREECLRKAERYLFEEMPVITLFTQNFQYLKQENLGLEISDVGIYDFKKASFQR